MATFPPVPNWRPCLKILVSDAVALKNAAKNVKTRKSTVNWVRIFENRCDENALDKTPPQFLSGFFASVHKEDGTYYEPGSLKVMQAAIDRHLKEKGYSLSIIKDR